MVAQRHEDVDPRLRPRPRPAPMSAAMFPMQVVDVDTKGAAQRLWDRYCAPSVGRGRVDATVVDVEKLLVRCLRRRFVGTAGETTTPTPYSNDAAGDVFSQLWSFKYRPLMASQVGGAGHAAWLVVPACRRGRCVTFTCVCVSVASCRCAATNHV